MDCKPCRRPASTVFCCAGRAANRACASCVTSPVRAGGGRDYGTLAESAFPRGRPDGNRFGDDARCNMDTHDDFDLWHALYRLEARYWHEVDCNGGHPPPENYLPDGGVVGAPNRFQGPRKIPEVYPGVESQAPPAI